MRIIAGRYGGRRLSAPVPHAARPTSDRVREAMFSMLQSRGALAGARVLDLFAGTGALGLEALSRGALHLVSVDKDPKAIAAIRKNIIALGVGSNTRVVRADVAKLTTTSLRAAADHDDSFDLLLLDPPYASVDVAIAFLENLAQPPLVHSDSLIVLEHGSGSHVPVPAHLQIEGQYRYGDTTIVLLAPIA